MSFVKNTLQLSPIPSCVRALVSALMIISRVTYPTTSISSWLVTTGNPAQHAVIKRKNHTSAAHVTLKAVCSQQLLDAADGIAAHRLANVSYTWSKREAGGATSTMRLPVVMMSDARSLKLYLHKRHAQPNRRGKKIMAGAHSALLSRCG